MMGCGGEGVTLPGGGGDGCGGSDEPDEGDGTEGVGPDGSGVGSWLPGVVDWGTGGWVSVTMSVVPGTVMMEVPGTVTTEPGTVTVVPGIVTVLPGTVMVLPGTVMVVPGIVTVSVTVKMVLLPPFSPGVLTVTEARPGLDGKTVVVTGGKEGTVDVSVMVTGGGHSEPARPPSRALLSRSWALLCSARWKRPNAWAWEDTRMAARVRRVLFCMWAILVYWRDCYG